MRRRYEFRRLRAAFLKVFLTTAALMAALGALYALLSSLGALDMLSYSFFGWSDSMRTFFGILSPLDLSDPGAYFCRMMVIPMFISSILWLVQGARALNEERAYGLGELLFTQPGTRSGFFWRRWSLGVGAIVTNLALLAGLTGLFFLLIVGNRDPGYYMLLGIVFLRMLPAHLFCWCTGIFCSCVFTSPAKASWAGFGILVGLTLTTLIPAATGWLSMAWYWSFLHYSIPEYALHVGAAYTLPQAIAMAVAALATVLPGWLMLRTKVIDCV